MMNEKIEDKRIYIKDLFDTILYDDIQKQIMNLLIQGKENEEIIELLLKTERKDGK